MDLSPTNRAFLTYLMKYQEAPPSFSEQLPAYFKVALIYSVLAVTASGLMIAIGLLSIAILIIGLVLGDFLRLVVTQRLSMQNWPLIVDIVDWEEAHRLAELHQIAMPKTGEPTPPAGPSATT